MSSESLRIRLVPLALAVIVPSALLAADIVDTAKADGHFTMLLKASTQAGAASWPKSPARGLANLSKTQKEAIARTT